jgi:hypothetical protein
MQMQRHSLFRYELLDVVHPQLVLHCNGITLERAGEQAWVIDLLQQRLTAWRHVAKVAVAVLSKELLQDLREWPQQPKPHSSDVFFGLCHLPPGERSFAHAGHCNDRGGLKGDDHFVVSEFK